MERFHGEGFTLLQQMLTADVANSDMLDELVSREDVTKQQLEGELGKKNFAEVGTWNECVVLLVRGLHLLSEVFTDGKAKGQKYTMQNMNVTCLKLLDEEGLLPVVLEERVDNILALLKCV